MKKVWAQETCPVTGLPFRTRREWVDVPLVPGYSATFCLIGERILLSAPCGNAGSEGMPIFLQTRERLLREMGLWEAPHVEIKDYDAIALRHDPIGRSQFTASMLTEAARGYLRGFWGYGGPLLFRWILRVAKQRSVGNRGPIPAAFVRDYRTAVLTANRELNRLRLAGPHPDGVGAPARPTDLEIRRPAYAQAEIQRYVDELLAYASSINWEGTQGDVSATEALSEVNPFKTVHAAITVLKHDFDTLLRQKEVAQGQVLRAAKLASLGTFAAGLAHELNNPLTTVTGFAQRLARADDAATRDQATAILRAAARMRTVIGQLDAERVAAAATGPVIVARCLQEVIALLEPELQRLEIELRQQVPDACQVQANLAQLQSVFVNLLSNACQALEGSTDGPRQIVIDAEEVAEWIEIAVDDSGTGMSDEVRARACEPFFTTKDVGRGSGLGLYLIHRIIEAHGGSLRLDKSPQGGCRVVIRLPRAPSDQN